MEAGLALQQAMRAALLANSALTTVLGGAHIFDEIPRGAKEPYVAFSTLETRDWSVKDAKAHEHFITLDVATARRTRADAQAIAGAIEQVLDNATLTLAGHVLINLRLVFWTIAKPRGSENFGATLRFRAATEPLP
jgi:Protein of unknown function (DUF3168)